MGRRDPIDPDVAADILFAADRTCCVCRIPGRPLQLHHINGDPSDNDPANIAALCLDCHDKTQLRGGFARPLDAAQVQRYKDDWLKRVGHRRDEADRLVAEALAEVPREVEAPETGVGFMRLTTPLMGYVKSLPKLRRRAIEAARPKWDSGIMAQMMEGSYGVINVLEDILVGLARYYPEGHFDGDNPRDYFSQLISSRFRWHRYHNEVGCMGTGGTIVGPMVSAEVIGDTEEMVAQMVRSLTFDESIEHGFDLKTWERDWKRDPEY